MGSVHRGHIHQFVQRKRLGVVPPCFLEQGGSLHRLKHVEVVGRCAAVRAQTYVGPGILEFVVRETVSGTEFGVGVDVVYAVDLPFAQDADVLRAEPESVSGNDIMVQYAQTVQILHGGEAAVRGLAVLDFLGGLAEMDVERQVPCLGELRSPDDHGLAHGIHGVEGHREQVTVITPGLVELVALHALLLLAFSRFRVVLVHHVVACGDPDAGFLDCLDRRGEGPVLVVESRSARSYHLYRGNAAAPIDEVVVDAGLYIPDAVDPVGKHDVLTDAAHEGHRGVGMHVDEPRYRDLAGAVHGFQSLGSGTSCRKYPGNLSRIYADVGRSVVDEDVLQENIGHVVRCIMVCGQKKPASFRPAEQRKAKGGTCPLCTR